MTNAWGGFNYAVAGQPAPAWAAPKTGAPSGGGYQSNNQDPELRALEERYGYDFYRQPGGGITYMAVDPDTGTPLGMKDFMDAPKTSGGGGGGSDGSAWASLAQRQAEFEYEKTQDILAQQLKEREFGLKERELGSSERTSNNQTKIAERGQALTERQQIIDQLESSQDRMLKQAEFLDNAKLTRAQMQEQARQFNFSQTMEQWQTAMSLIPQLGELSLKESERVQKTLENGTDFVYRAWESRGEKSPLARVTQADQINAIHTSMNQLRDFMTSKPPVYIPEIDTPEMPSFGAMGEMPGMPGMPAPLNLDYGTTPAAAPSAGGGAAAGGGAPAPVWGANYGAGGSMPAYVPPAPAYNPAADRDSWESPGGDTNLAVPTYHGPALMSDRAAHASEPVAAPGDYYGLGGETGEPEWIPTAPAAPSAPAWDLGSPVGPQLFQPHPELGQPLGPTLAKIPSSIWGWLTDHGASAAAPSREGPYGTAAYKDGTPSDGYTTERLFVGNEKGSELFENPTGAPLRVHDAKATKKILKGDKPLPGFDEGDGSYGYDPRMFSDISGMDYGAMAGSMFGGPVSNMGGGGLGLWGNLARRTPQWGAQVEGMSPVIRRGEKIPAYLLQAAQKARVLPHYAAGTNDPFQQYNSAVANGQPYDATAALQQFNPAGMLGDTGAQAMEGWGKLGGGQLNLMPGGGTTTSAMAMLNPNASDQEYANYYSKWGGRDQTGHVLDNPYDRAMNRQRAQQASRTGPAARVAPNLEGVDFMSLLKRTFPNQDMVTQEGLVAAADKILPPAIRDTLAGKYAAPLRVPEAMGDVPSARALSILTDEERDALGNYTGLKYNTGMSNVSDVAQRLYGVPVGAARRAMVAGGGI